MDGGVAKRGGCGRPFTSALRLTPRRKSRSGLVHHSPTTRAGNALSLRGLWRRNFVDSPVIPVDLGY